MTLKTKTFEDLLTRKATKEELQELIVMAGNEIKEWEEFIEMCEGKIKELS